MGHKKKIDLRSKDREAEIYNRIEQAIPGSKIIEVQAQYSDWFYYETPDKADVLIRTVLHLSHNVVQLLVLAEVVSIFQFNLEHRRKKLFNIYEYDIPNDKVHSDWDLWVDRDQDRVREMDARDSYLDIPKLLLFASEQMKAIGK